MRHGRFAQGPPRSRGQADAAVHLPSPRRLLLGLQPAAQVCSGPASRSVHPHLLESDDGERSEPALLRLVPFLGSYQFFR